MAGATEQKTPASANNDVVILQADQCPALQVGVRVPGARIPPFLGPG